MPSFFRTRKLAKNFVEKGQDGSETPLSEDPVFYMSCCLPTCWLGAGLYFFIDEYKYGWTTQTQPDLIISLYVLICIVVGGVGGFLNFLLYLGECRTTRRAFELIASAGLSGLGVYAIWFNGQPTASIKASRLYIWILSSFAFVGFFFLYALALHLASLCERGEDREFRRQQDSAKGRITSIADVDLELGAASTMAPPQPPPRANAGVDVARVPPPGRGKGATGAPNLAPPLLVPPPPGADVAKPKKMAIKKKKDPKPQVSLDVSPEGAYVCR